MDTVTVSDAANDQVSAADALSSHEVTMSDVSPITASDATPYAVTATDG